MNGPKENGVRFTSDLTLTTAAEQRPGARSQSDTAARIDPAAVTLYQQTHARLVDRIRPGLRATVHIDRPDGTAVDGYDEYAWDEDMRLGEVRGDRESVVVGERLCIRESNGEAECEDGREIDLGLRPVWEEDVLHAAVSDAPCGSSTCREVHIVQRAGDLSPEQLLTASGPKTGEASYYEFRLLVGADGLPFSVEEARLAGGRLVEARVLYTYDYAANVAPIDHGVP